MKKFYFLLLFFAAMCSMVANAETTKYQINVAGVEVTSDHCYIRTDDSNDITSGYAVYTPNNNTLTCYGLRIRRSGNGNYGIHNRDCAGLTIVFKGGYNQVASADHALNLARSTSIVVEEDSKADIYTGGGAHALNLGSYSYYIKGGELNLDGKNAIHGNGSGSTTVYFQGRGTYTRSMADNHVLESFKAVFNEGSDLKIEANDNMTSVNNTSMYFYGKEKILEPFGAYYSNSAVYNSSGSQITSDDIYISDDYVAIVNQDYFPDLNFRIEMRNLFPKGYITASDVASTKKITLYNKAISNLEGLQYFTELTEFYCRSNNITTLPISALTKLETLDCGYNKITSLTITGRSALKKLYVNDNPITSLNCNNNALTDLSVLNCTSLATINCANNKLTSVNFSWCTALKTLYCQANQFTTNGLGTLPSSLETLNCSYNQLTTLTITGRNAFKSLDVSNNTSLTKLECQNNSLTSLNVNNCTAMQELDCRFNKLTSLNVSSCTALKNLYSSANQLTAMPSLPNSIEVVDASDNNFTGTMTITGKSALRTLNVANNPLTKLECHSNALTALAIGGCSELSYLDCSKNKLASLDVRGLKKLATLRAHSNGMTSFYGTYCSALKILLVCYNNLTSLDVTGCTALSELWIQKNQIKGNAMTSLINTLRSIPTSESEGLFGVFEPSYTGMAEGNQITNTQNMAARAKRWIPKQYNSGWQEINLKGDVNGDGKINVSDVTALINMIMGITTMDETVADVNGDGKVNVSDVSALINIILGIG